MLKIKDNVDLKELEKFGFVPKYDENTGEVKEYYKYVYGEDKLNERKFRFEIFPYGRFIKHYAWLNCATWHDIANDEVQDTLYDLIKADLVEKGRRLRI